MLRIGITGVKGLIGWHLRCRLHILDDVEIIPADRQTFQSDEALQSFVRQCDGLVHLAGMNRGDDADIERVNTELARRLVAALEYTGSRPHVVFASSTHIDRETAYGRSKRIAGDILKSWSERHGAPFANLILPHVFGECGRPFYNSVVSTFCHQLAVGETPRIDVDGQLELMHTQDVAQLVLDVLMQGFRGEIRPAGSPMLVSELLARLETLSRSYLDGGVIPRLDDMLTLRLFNTFRSFLFPRRYPVPLKLHTDNRGSLFEGVKSLHGGQAFLSTTRPGITRGDHFHFTKVERFLVVSGQGVIRLRRLFDDEIHEFAVSGDSPVFVDMPSLYTHNISNIGKSDMLTLFWSHEIFDPRHPDTFPEKV